MRKKLVVLMIAFLTLLLSAEKVFAHSNSAPSMECFSCHRSVDGQGGATVKVSGLPTVYEPGKVYKITVSVESSLKSYGDAQGGFAVRVSAGEIILTDEKNTQLSNGFLTHTLEGSRHRKWTFSWKAPMSKTEVDIRIMAVAVNGDYTPTNDAIATAVFTLKPKK